MDIPRERNEGLAVVPGKQMHDKPIATRRADKRNRVRRAHVMSAFRAMAHGVSGAAAWTRTLSFYRTASSTWARQLG